MPEPVPPYLNVDDEFPDHPKVDALSDGAFRLHVAGMAYGAKNLSDGIVPEGRVARLTPGYRPAQLAELVKARVWHRGGQGCATETCLAGQAGEYVVHDFLQWNKPAQWWVDRREAETKRKRAWRERQQP